jgi:hypothetical protein
MLMCVSGRSLVFPAHSPEETAEKVLSTDLASVGKTTAGYNYPRVREAQLPTDLVSVEGMTVSGVGQKRIIASTDARSVGSHPIPALL